MRVIIAGTRSIEDYARVSSAVADSEFVVDEVVSGAARGVDELGERWAQERGLPVVQFPAQWEKHGKAAGPKRNARMARYADALIAVWDGESSGTRDMLRKAYRRGLCIHLVHAADGQTWTNAPAELAC